MGIDVPVDGATTIGLDMSTAGDGLAFPLLPNDQGVRV